MAAEGESPGPAGGTKTAPPCNRYYLRTVSIGEWLAYPPKLTVELGSYVDGEAHGWAR